MKYKREGNAQEVDDTRDNSDAGKEHRASFGAKLAFEFRLDEERAKRAKAKKPEEPPKKKGLLDW